MDLYSLFLLAWPVMLKGTGYTLLFAVVSMLLGLPLAGLITLTRVLGVWGLNRLMALYVSVMRGTPLLVQVFIVYYGLPSVGIELSPITAGIVTLTLNVAAYMSETLRGAINAVAQGQWQAGTSLGMTRPQTLRYVIAPQALKAAVPSLSNSLISLIKDTSLVSVIAVTELMLATKELISTTFQPFPLYMAAAAIYWMLSLSFEQLQRWMEKRLAYPH
jgi:cystine transport system permease protein